ncbi:MAG: lysostaphin resistance A-like protein [Acidimicrobiales bacterium]
MARQRVGGRSWGLLDYAVGVVAAYALSWVAAAALTSRLSPLGAAAGVAAAAGEENPFLRSSGALDLYGVAVLQLPLSLTQLAVVVNAAERKGRGLAAELGLRIRPVDALVGLGGGVAAQLLAALFYVALSPFLDTDDLSGPARSLTERASVGGMAVVLLWLVVAVLAPVVEELVYRGLLLRSLERLLDRRLALVISSFLFAAVHIQLLQLPGLFIAGLTFGVIAQRSGRLGGAMLAHAVFNALSLVQLLR